MLALFVDCSENISALMSSDLAVDASPKVLGATPMEDGMTLQTDEVSVGDRFIKVGDYSRRVYVVHSLTDAHGFFQLRCRTVDLPQGVGV